MATLHYTQTWQHYTTLRHGNTTHRSDMTTLHNTQTWQHYTTLKYGNTTQRSDMVTLHIRHGNITQRSDMATQKTSAMTTINNARHIRHKAMQHMDL